MGLGPYSALKSDGTIDDTPATCFRYKIAEEFHVYFSQDKAMLDAMGVLAHMGAGVGQVAMTDFVSFSLDDGWIIHIENTDGVDVFRQRVNIGIQMTALVHGVAGMTMASLFTWYAKDGSEIIETTHFGIEAAEPKREYEIGRIDEYEGVVCHGSCDEFTQRFWEQKLGATFEPDWWRATDFEWQIAHPPAGSIWVPIAPGIQPSIWDMLVVRYPHVYHLGIVHKIDSTGIQIANATNSEGEPLGYMSYAPVAPGGVIAGWFHWLGPAIPHWMAETTVAELVDGAATEIAGDQLAGFPPAGSAYIGPTKSSGQFRARAERIDYEAIDLTSKPHKLTGCKRGRLGRPVQTHAVGDKIMEAPPIQTGGDFGINSPGGGSDFTTWYGIVLFEWESPIYALQVPGGAKVKFAGHWAGRKELPLNLDIVSTAVCAGDTWCAIYFKETGFWWIADSGSGSGVEVRAGPDLRALAVTVSDAIAAPQNPQPATVQAPYDGKAGTGTCSTPILLRAPGALRPVLVYTRGDTGYAQDLLGIGEEQWRPAVQITSKPVVASAYDPNGNLVLICASGNTMFVGVSGVSKCADSDAFMPQVAEEFAAKLIDDEGKPQAFPSLAGNRHALEIPRPGRLKLLCNDGKYYESQDGGRTWRQ